MARATRTRKKPARPRTKARTSTRQTPRRGPVQRRGGGIRAGGCSCNDKPQIRGNSTVTVNGTEAYVLESPVKRDMDNVYDCELQTGTDWNIEAIPGETGDAEIVSPGKTGCRVRGLTKGRVNITVVTTSECKCRPDGHKIQCTCTKAERTIRVV